MKRIHLHPLPLRIWHWTNALLILALIGTGLYLRSQGIASLSPHDTVLMWHETMGYIAVAGILFWFIYNMVNGNIRRHYLLGKGDISGIAAQARYYLHGIFKGGKNPHRPSTENKYNPLQRIAYGGVMFLLLPASAVTGLLFLDISAVREPLLRWGLFGLLDAVHVAAAYLVAVFVISHLYMATLGETFFSHTKTMITGYEEEAEEGVEEGGTESAAIGVIQKGRLPNEETKQ